MFQCTILILMKADSYILYESLALSLWLDSSHFQLCRARAGRKLMGHANVYFVLAIGVNTPSYLIVMTSLDVLAFEIFANLIRVLVQNIQHSNSKSLIHSR